METKIPPFALRISVKDSLYARFTSRDSNRNADVRARIILDDGTSVDNTWRLTTTGGYSVVTGRFPLCNGWLIAASVRSTAAPVPGGSFVSVELHREETSVPAAQIALIQGFISFYRVISWPGVQPSEPLSVGPYPDVVLPSNPGAGIQLTHTVGVFQVYDLWGLHMRLNTSATAITRRVGFRIDTGAGGNVLYRKVCAVTQAQSLTRYYNFYFGNVADYLADTSFQLSLPRITLLPGYRIVTEVVNLQVGDTITNAIIKQGRRLIA